MARVLLTAMLVAAPFLVSAGCEYEEHRGDRWDRGRHERYDWDWDRDRGPRYHEDRGRDWR
jgi:hypothetical protein